MVRLNGKKIDTVFFDIGGVLLDISPEAAHKQLSIYTGLDIKIIQKTFPGKAHDAYEKGEIDDDTFFEAYRENLPYHNGLTSGQFWQAWSRYIVKETPVVELLEKVSKNKKTWLLSNTNPMHIHKDISAYSFPKLIDGAVYSFEVGLRKPDEQIYLKAVEIAETKLESSLFIDDLNENIESAKKVGMNAIQFIHPKQLEEALADFNCI
jgi:putative hydrolase of the HAD superfamily